MMMMVILLQAPYFVITSVDSKSITEMQREREKEKGIFLGGCDLPIPVPGIIASEGPGLSAERETGGGRRGPFDVMWGPDAG
jgi:hypothetical protein